MKKIILLFFLLLIISCASQENIDQSIDSSAKEKIIDKPQEKISEKTQEIVKTLKTSPKGYPQTISSLTLDELEKIKLRVEKTASKDCNHVKKIINNKEVLYTPTTIEIDNYGYIKRVSCYDPVKKSFSSKSVESAAREYLEEYDDYLGVKGIKIKFKESNVLDNDFIISTQGQKYNNLPVITENGRSASIRFIISPSDVLKDLTGRYYEKINIPTSPEITLEEARNNLIGATVKDKTVKKSSLLDGKLAVLVKESGGRQEYRLVWMIDLAGFEDIDFAFVDALTGENLS